MRGMTLTIVNVLFDITRNESRVHGGNLQMYVLYIRQTNWTKEDEVQGYLYKILHHVWI